MKRTQLAVKNANWVLFCLKIINLSKILTLFQYFYPTCKYLYIHKLQKSQTMTSKCINSVIKFNELYNKENKILKKY